MIESKRGSAMPTNGSAILRSVLSVLAALPILVAGCEYRKLGPDANTTPATVDGAADSPAQSGDGLSADSDVGPARDAADAPDSPAGPARLSIDSTAHDFGTVVTQTPSAEAVFTVTDTGSTGTGALVVALTPATAAAQGFALKNDHCSGVSLAAGASCQVAVVVAATASEVLSADLTVSAGSAGSVSAHLTALALVPGALKLTPETQTFGMVVQNRGGATQTFTVTNSGQQSTSAVMVTLGGTDKAEFQVTADGCTAQVLPATGSCQITVRFAPVSLGAKSASLTVAATTGGSAVAQLSGTGITQGTLALSPDTHDFGSIQQMTAGASQAFMVKNTGLSSPPASEAATARISRSR